MARDVNALINKCENAITQEQPRATILPLRFQQISLEKLLFSRFSTVQM